MLGHTNIHITEIYADVAMEKKVNPSYPLPLDTCPWYNGWTQS